MEAGSSWTQNGAFVLREEDITKLWKLLESRIGQPEITATCADDVERRFASAKELAGYENDLPRQVTKLSIAAHSSDWQKRASITLRDAAWGPITVSLNGRLDVVERLNEELRRLLSGTRPWFSRMARVDFMDLMFIVYLLTWLGLTLFLAFAGADKPAESSTRAHALAHLTFYGFLAVLVSAGWALNRFSRRLFPVASFLIGQGKRRFETAEKFRWTAVVGLCVSVLGSLPATILA